MSANWKQSDTHSRWTSGWSLGMIGNASGKSDAKFLQCRRTGHCQLSGFPILQRPPTGELKTPAEFRCRSPSGGAGKNGATHNERVNGINLSVIMQFG